MGIPANLFGYGYLKAAILYAAEQPISSYQLKKLYGKVAENCSTNSACVERSIRSAIQAAYDRDPQTLKSAFYYPVEKPTNAELIGMVADKIRTQMLLNRKIQQSDQVP